MSKRKSEDVLAYVHSVSPQKQSNKSFNVRIQVETESIKKGVCFDRSLRQKLLTAKVSEDAVKITSILKNEEDDVKKYHADYILNSATSVETVDQINVPFARKIPEVEFISLDKEPELGGLVCVKGVLDLTHAVVKTVNFGSRKVDVMDQCYIYNETGSIEIALWDEWITYVKEMKLQNVTHFILSNLLVKEFDKGIRLATCSDTVCQPVKDELPPSQPSAGLVTVTKVFKLSEINTVHEIQYGYICTTCKKIIPVRSQDEKIVHCIACKTYRKAQPESQTCQAVIEAKEFGKDLLKIDLALLNDLLGFPVTFKTDKNDVIAKILDLADINVTVDERLKVIVLVEKAKLSLSSLLPC